LSVTALRFVQEFSDLLGALFQLFRVPAASIRLLTRDDRGSYYFSHAPYNFFGFHVARLRVRSGNPEACRS
jgi:hypothetical protein